MQICQEHWKRLRQAIEDRGLAGLIAGDGTKAVEALKRELAGTPEPGDYDPLMLANWDIMSHALDCGGMYLMSPDDNGNPYCPLCEAAAKGGPGTDEEWIVGCSNSQLRYAQERGLVTKHNVN